MGKQDVRLPLNIPDMVLLSEGITAHWLFTARSTGTVLKRKVADLLPDKIKTCWMRAADKNPKNFERHVAMLYDGKTTPTILADKAFESLVAAMARDCKMGNKILQRYILPLNNALYRATFSKKGKSIVQQVVLIRHSHVYRPLSTTANVIYPTRHMRAVGERSREGPEEIMPAPPEGIRNECIRSLQVLMHFMSKAWHLDLDEVVCEFVCDSDHKMWMVRVVSFDWREGQFLRERWATKE